VNSVELFTGAGGFALGVSKGASTIKPLWTGTNTPAPPFA